MRDKLERLLDVRSIVTMILTIVFSILCLRNEISTEQFLTVYTVITSFYFCVQLHKQENAAQSNQDTISDK